MRVKECLRGAGVDFVFICDLVFGRSGFLTKPADLAMYKPSNAYCNDWTRRRDDSTGVPTNKAVFMGRRFSSPQGERSSDWPLDKKLKYLTKR